MKLTQTFLFLSLLATATGRSGGFDVRCADRAAIERVYHAHRIGEKPPFEQVLPAELIGRLVRIDRRKEAVLRRVYGVEITPAMLAAEVRRMDATTRAPQILAEIRHALGDDPGRFALGIARPILVERELRRRFENDDKLHAARRHEAEQARKALLAGQSVENNYQGRVAVNGVNFDSASAGHDGLFKFALIDAAGTTTYWSNWNDDITGYPMKPTTIPMRRSCASSEPRAGSAHTNTGEENRRRFAVGLTAPLLVAAMCLVNSCASRQAGPEITLAPGTPWREVAMVSGQSTGTIFTWNDHFYDVGIQDGRVRWVAYRSDMIRQQTYQYWSTHRPPPLQPPERSP